MKKQYIKPTTTTLKVQGTNTLMTGSGNLNGSVEGIQPDENFGIDISWAGSSKQDTQEKDNQGRLWVD